MLSIFRKATNYSAQLVVIVGLIKPLIELITEVNEAYDKRKIGEQKKEDVMALLKTILEQTNELSPVDLPTATILQAADKLIDVLVTILKSAGVIEN